MLTQKSREIVKIAGIAFLILLTLSSAALLVLSVNGHDQQEAEDLVNQHARMMKREVPYATGHTTHIQMKRFYDLAKKDRAHEEEQEGPMTGEAVIGLCDVEEGVIYAFRAQSTWIMIPKGCEHRRGILTKLTVTDLACKDLEVKIELGNVSPMRDASRDAYRRHHIVSEITCSVHLEILRIR